MTQAGMILGSAAYMSPEQAKGRAVDKRADIWAFGADLSPSGAMMAVPIAVSGTAVSPGEPVRLFATRIYLGGLDEQGRRQYDVARRAVLDQHGTGRSHGADHADSELAA